MGFPSDGGFSMTAAEFEIELDKAIRKIRPPWYERTPWSWIIGTVFAVLTAVVVNLLGLA